MDFGLVAGDTNATIYLRLRDSTTGLAKTGLVFNSAGAVASYTLPGAARAAITLATQTVTGAHSDGGFVEVDATNCKGLYRLDLPDAAIASGNFTIISIEFDGIIEESVMIPLHTKKVNVTQIGGDAQSLTDLKDFADAGYDPATNKVEGVKLADTTTTNTDMRGTDSAALASVCTEGRLAELDAANLPSDVDTLLTRITSTLFSGITSLAEWLGLIAGKQTPDATAQTEIRATGAGSGTYDATTDSQEGIRDTAPLGTAMRGTDNALLASSNGSGLTEAGGTGDHLTAIPWNSTWDAEVESEVDDALVAFFTSAANLVDLIWDEVITGASHNVNNSAAKFLREASEAIGVTGTAQAGGATSITLAATESATNDLYNFERVRIIEGTGAGQSRLITDYDGGTKVATVDRAWTTNPSSDSVYVISSADATVEAIGTQLVSATATVDFDDLAAILLDTDELQIDWADGGRLDLLIDALATAAELAKVPKSDGTASWNATALAAIEAECEDALQLTVPDSVPADGTRPNMQQAVYMAVQLLSEFAISGTTYTVKKPDGSTTLFTLTLDDATNPTSATRAT